MKVSPVFLVLALAASGAIAAEDMYRSTMPDGSVRYGESPEFGAKSVRKVVPPPPATGVTVVTPEERTRQVVPREGSTMVLPTPPRKPPPAATQGQLHGPGATELPSRSY